MEYPEVFTKALTDWYWLNQKDGTQKELTQFLEWNEAKVRGYLKYWETHDRSNGVTEMEQESNRFEGAPIATRFKLFIEENKTPTTKNAAGGGGKLKNPVNP
jgi:hypothetical protein